MTRKQLICLLDRRNAQILDLRQATALLRQELEKANKGRDWLVRICQKLAEGD